MAILAERWNAAAAVGAAAPPSATTAADAAATATAATADFVRGAVEVCVAESERVSCTRGPPLVVAALPAAPPGFVHTSIFVCAPWPLPDTVVGFLVWLETPVRWGCIMGGPESQRNVINILIAVDVSTTQRKCKGASI